MKDPSDEIRQYFFDLLDGNVSYSGSDVSVYTFAPKDETMPYILIGEHSMVSEEQTTKDCYITEHNLVIEVWTQFTGNDASYVPVNSISDSLLQLCRTRSITQSMTGYNIISITIIGTNTERFNMDNRLTILKSIIIKLILEES